MISFPSYDDDSPIGLNLCRIVASFIHLACSLRGATGSQAARKTQQALSVVVSYGYNIKFDVSVKSFFPCSILKYNCFSPRSPWLLDLPKNEKGYRDCRDITATHLLHHNHLVVIECKKRMCTRQSFTLPRSADERRSPEVDRSELGSTLFRCRVESCEMISWCVQSPLPLGEHVSHTPGSLSDVFYNMKLLSNVSDVYPTPASSDVVRSFLSRFQSL
ncbi:hypothetical protein G5I_14692 [Acromyrmex echinatior]|uniref:Uncharacterized protein n=1 Tax=Acromyrmex echinatior TaxID=103372 RepID=F4X8F3_ACREC|nr:hypothetical protein G5I_14692 [Acromyrmex echinatior]